MNSAHIQMLLAEDSASDGDLILASLAKVSLAEATHVVHDGVETLVKLPRLDGFEVLREIKAHSRTRLIPIVLLTSSNIDADVARGYLLGANSYVQKPVDFEQFRETIGQLGLYWMTTNEPPPPKQLAERLGR
jgi:two-component system response regulator